MRHWGTLLILAGAVCQVDAAGAGVLTTDDAKVPEKLSFGGVYPHLAMYNKESECGIGAVVPWAERLWVVTYAPHKPLGSTDKLYEIDNELEMTIRAESVGGTPANRMIHSESDQLIIGFHLIDSTGRVRTISPLEMPGRPTGTARHLSDPERWVYIATMEEGLYEVDVQTLAVRCLLLDGNRNDGARVFPEAVRSALPGYHGKGLYTGQGRLLYSNNGERGGQAQRDPTTPSGALAEWEPGGDWQLLVREQFTEITGPGGIRGATSSDDPVWAMGWDHCSIILHVLDDGEWSTFRLPKACSSYDGAHGWNTEWPRIREIGQGDRLLATMHGTFWSFPRRFTPTRTSGLVPRSNHLRVVGDFCRWDGKVVLGCDDSASNEFLNKRPLKGTPASPLQSNSNLWFVDPGRLERLGPPLGSGGVWFNEALARGAVSDPYLLAGYDYRTMHIWHHTPYDVTFAVEIDRAGNGTWQELTTIRVPAGGAHLVVDENERGQWVRVRCVDGAHGATVWFNHASREERGARPSDIFDGLAASGSTTATGGVLRGLGDNRKSMGLVVVGSSGDAAGTYEIDRSVVPRSVHDETARARVLESAPAPNLPLHDDGASLVVEEDGKRYRLPRQLVSSAGRPGWIPRIAREVVTERDLLNAGGTFFVLPSRNSGGAAGIRPIASHPFAIHDFGSCHGLLYMTGVEADANGGRIRRSEDSFAATWAGVIDELWDLGKPVGVGGPWKHASVAAGEASDPYLMHGYDHRRVILENHGEHEAMLVLQSDPSAAGRWIDYETFSIEGGGSREHAFPAGYRTYWVRVRAQTDGVVSATFYYE